MVCFWDVFKCILTKSKDHTGKVWFDILIYQWALLPFYTQNIFLQHLIPRVIKCCKSFHFSKNLLIQKQISLQNLKGFFISTDFRMNKSRERGKCSVIHLLINVNSSCQLRLFVSSSSFLAKLTSLIFPALFPPQSLCQP